MSDPFAVRDPGDPAKWPIGCRVVVPEAEDFHFFRPGTTGTVTRYSKAYPRSDYLAVIVQLDTPIRCSHGHFEHVIEEFNFNAVDLREAE